MHTGSICRITGKSSSGRGLPMESYPWGCTVKIRPRADMFSFWTGLLEGPLDFWSPVPTKFSSSLIVTAHKGTMLGGRIMQVHMDVEGMRHIQGSCPRCEIQETCSFSDNNMC